MRLQFKKYVPASKATRATVDEKEDDQIDDGGYNNNSKVDEIIFPRFNVVSSISTEFTSQNTGWKWWHGPFSHISGNLLNIGKENDCCNDNRKEKWNETHLSKNVK